MALGLPLVQAALLSFRDVDLAFGWVAWRTNNGYSTETLVRQKAKGLSLDALLGTKMSTLLKSVLALAYTPALFQH